jgi:tRNA threonylcarbamoyl adenosine modification protein (Sua5/YciO/YrdC/YwlC family)
MASEVLTIHSQTPEIRKITIVANALKDGAVILYPTDTGFTLGCALENKQAINRIRSIRRLPADKALTFLCESLSNVALFAKVSNTAYRTIKRLIPGPYTFVLPASKEVPKFAQNPKRKTAGIRVPDNVLSQLLLKELGAPIISISAKIGDDLPISNTETLIKKFMPFVDIAVRSDKYNFVGESTVIDMTTDDFAIIRHGAGITKVLDYVDIENP